MNRLGINGPDEVKNHPWIKNFPFEKLYTKEIDSPFVPSVKIIFFFNIFLKSQ